MAQATTVRSMAPHVVRHYGCLFTVLLASACEPYGPRYCDNIDPHACDGGPPGPRQRLRDFRREQPAGAPWMRPPLGQPVDLRAVTVTAVDQYLEGPNGSVGDVWIQERVTDPDFRGCAPHPDGGRVCGIQLYAPTLVPAGTHLLEGDIVNVAGGRYEEFNCTPCCAPPRPPCLFPDGRTLPELSYTSVERVGSGPPIEPIAVTIQQVLDGGDAYLGVLVRLTEDVTVGATDRRGEIQIADGVKLTPQLTALVVPGTSTPLAEGMRLRRLTGIVSYFFGTKIIPRSTDDYEVVR